MSEELSEGYIDLNRSFTLFSKNNEHDDNLFLSQHNSKNWNDLKDLSRVIILAEAGVGKTEEIRAITREMRSSGEKAFFLRLEYLKDGFENSFEIGNLEEFNEWLLSDELAYFFLDSVDEARMYGSKQFELAVRELSNKLGNHKQRAHIYITSRISEWRGKSDLNFIRKKLPSFTLEDKNKGQKSLDPSVFTLQALDKNQIQLFAKASGVPDSDDFMIAIEKAEAGIFAARPQDLIDLIAYWKTNGEISNRAKMIELNIERKLKERCACEGVLSTWCKSMWEYAINSVAESNCVTARWGGEQQEAKGQSVG